MLCMVKQWKTWEKELMSEFSATKKTIENEHQNQAICHQKIDNDLVAIRKSKVTLKLNKPAYVEMCILDLCKVLM